MGVPPPPRDVRMRGFQHRDDVEAVQRWVDDRPLPDRPPSRVSLPEAAGRRLAADVQSDVDVPGFARAAMDGWAVRGEDTFGAAPAEPVVLRVVGRCLPGAAPEGVVGPGQAMRIMTGAPLPDGADAVLRAEDGEERAEDLEVRVGAGPGRHVGAVGEDVRRGDVVLRTGRRLRPQDLGVLASIGRAEVPVVPRPRVAILITGDEILPAGSKAEGAAIVDANGPMLAALIARDGGESSGPRYVRDGRDPVEAAMREAADGSADLVLVSGGSSVGEEDHAPRILADTGTLAFHGVALRPASPSGVGTLEGVPFFLVPGNPVSCLSAYDLFAGRLVRRLASGSPAWPYVPELLPLAGRIVSALGRMDYVRVAIDEGTVVPLMARGASILTSTTRADGFVLVPRDSEGHPEGASVVVHRYA